MKLSTELELSHPEVCQWRHDLHMIPEIGFELYKTSDYIANKLTHWKLTVDRRFGKCGVVGIIDGKLGPGRTIAFRIDMDALPMEDRSGKSYASTHQGFSHACGHDGHMAIALNVAKYLSENNSFFGRVIFLFQPAEEIGAGAKLMMDEGLFDVYPFDEVYGFHNMPRLQANKMFLRYGAMTGSADKFTLNVHGQGGHSSVPHLSVNPITLTSQIVSLWQSIISETVSSLASGVLCVTKINGGDTFNAITDHCSTGGTIRYFEYEIGETLRNRMITIANSIAELNGTTASITFEPLCHATVNTKEQTDIVIAIGKNIFGEQNVDTQVSPSPGGEDMSYFKNDDSVGSCYFMIGSNGYNLHTSDFDFDDSIIIPTSKVLIEIVNQRCSA